MVITLAPTCDGRATRTAPPNRSVPTPCPLEQRRRIAEALRSITTLGVVTDGLADGAAVTVASRTRPASRPALRRERDTSSVSPRYTTIYTGWRP
ncbi:hypothetical protein NJ7G_0251 [Natrinema sp. J7-2]|nr:hypothetical protein NJ7G_0251 [Natrinema sp. J7-2]